MKRPPLLTCIPLHFDSPCETGLGRVKLGYEIVKMGRVVMGFIRPFRFDLLKLELDQMKLTKEYNIGD